MDLQVRVANLERANRRWKLLFTVIIGVWPILLIAGGMSSSTTRNEVADEIRTRTLVVVDDKGNVVGSFDSSGLTMRQGNQVTKVGPAGITVAYSEKSSVKIGGSRIRVCGFDAEKKKRYEELLEQRRRDDVKEEEARKMWYEAHKINYEPELVGIGYVGRGDSGIIHLSNARGGYHNQISAND